MRRRWVSIGVRVLADALIALGSLAAGFAARLWLAEEGPGAAASSGKVDLFAGYYLRQAPLLAASLILSFSALGVYTRTRFYARRFKAAALAQGVSIAYAVFLLAVYFGSGSRQLIPRGAFLVAYLLTLALALGSRWAKAQLERRFRPQTALGRGQRRARNILVVGGAGYIGSSLVRDLLADGYRVRVLDSLVFGDESIRDLYQDPDFELIRGDFRHVGPVVEAVRRMDAVIHLGAIVGDPACALDEDETLSTNLAATRLLAEVARASGVSRILFASTCSVYGAADHLVDERSALNPVSLYAATKIDSEKVLLGARSRDFHPVILRLATAFGWSPRPRFDLVVNLLAARAAVDRHIQIFNGQQWRPFIHVRDISSAFRRLLEAPLEASSGEIFNVGSNHMNHTLGQLAEQIAWLDPGLAVEHVANADARDYRVSFDKIHSRLGFECQVTLAEGVREIQQAIRDGLVADYRDPRYSNVQQMTLRRDRAKYPEANGEVEWTFLRFAKNSAWHRSVAAAGVLSHLP